MKILIVSGFLGSGKTTFIKEMIKKTQMPLVVLENEYGETDLDSKDISSSGGEELNIMEFSEGCVCCTKKDTFANSLIAISASLNPDHLIVEPSGVGKLSNILEAAGKVVWEQIELLKPVVIIAPQSYHYNIREYGEICKDQIRNASYIVLSHLDHADRAETELVTKEIRKLNTSAPIIDTPYTELGSSWFTRLLDETEDKKIIASAKDEPQLDQYTLKKCELKNPVDLVRLLEDVIHGRAGSLPRAKGVVSCEDEWFRFDVANGYYSIIGCEDENPSPQCVFIGNEIDRKRINSYFEIDNFSGDFEWNPSEWMGRA